MQSIYSEFRKKAAATPDTMAVQDGSRALTYAQLDALAGQSFRPMRLFDEHLCPQGA